MADFTAQTILGAVKAERAPLWPLPLAGSDVCSGGVLLSDKTKFLVVPRASTAAASQPVAYEAYSKQNKLGEKINSTLHVNVFSIALNSLGLPLCQLEPTYLVFCIISIPFYYKLTS